MAISMDDLTAWLTQIWDEDGRAARLEKQLADDFFDADDFTVEYQWARMTKHTNGAYGSSFSKGAPSPTEVLARIAADRQILDLAEEASFLDRCLPGHDEGPYIGDRILRAIASAYADRPGYQEEWRP